jgi:hypothetical protein
MVLSDSVLTNFAEEIKPSTTGRVRLLGCWPAACNCIEMLTDKYKVHRRRHPNPAKHSFKFNEEHVKMPFNFFAQKSSCSE